MSEIPSGAMRFNSDSQKLEYWDGSQWVQVHTFSPNLDGGARGVYTGGFSPSPGVTANSDYINLSSTGDAQSFGDISSARRYVASCSSSTRGLTMGGTTPSNINEIIKTEISSTGSHADFGDLTESKYAPSGYSNQTRGISFGGYATPLNVNTIEYVTISSEGNAVNFGDMTYASRYSTCAGSKTRAMPMGGYVGPAATSTINLVTIATTGDAQDFGDLSQAIYDSQGATGNGTRTVIHIRDTPANPTTLDQYNPISGGSNSSFGDLTVARLFSSGNTCLSSPTRGFFGSGYVPGGSPTYTDTIDYVLFATEGNAVDFGDAASNGGIGSAGYGAFSNAHGGL